jgi:hypothetical protein
VGVCAGNAEQSAVIQNRKSVTITQPVEGELETELRDSRSFTLRPGMNYQVSDFGDAGHRSSTKTGAKLFIVD